MQPISHDLALHDEPACHREAGVSLIELLVILSVIGILALAVAPSMGRSLRNQSIKAKVDAASGLLRIARAEAIRTGENRIVFFGPAGTTDPAGTALIHTDGGTAPVLVLSDGPPATSNCRIDAGEAIQSTGAEPGLNWGVSLATVRAPGDTGGAAFAPPQASGSTFADSASNPVNWLLFRPDGIPVVFNGSGGVCGTIGRTGSGGAALYITNGYRDYAVVLSPLGSVRVRSWNPGSLAWSD